MQSNSSVKPLRTVRDNGPLPADIYAGSVLRQLRRDKKMSQARIAAEFGVTFQQVQKYESGANRISVSMLAKICEVLNVSPRAFFAADPGVVPDIGLTLSPEERDLILALRRPGWCTLLHSFRHIVDLDADVTRAA